MTKRRKQTPAERAYSKQVKRIKQFIRRAEKRGYQFSENVLPQRPKRVTQASVRKLAKLTPEKMYQKAVYGGLASDGEIVPAIEGVKLERSLRAKKATETRKRKKKISTPSVYIYYPTISIIDTIRDRLSELTREAKPPIPIENRKNELLAIFEDSITLYGDNIEEYEHYLEAHESEIADLLNVISYDSNAEQVSASFVEIGRLLNTQSLSMSQAENLSMMAEYYNS